MKNILIFIFYENYLVYLKKKTIGILYYINVKLNLYNELN